MSGVYIKGMAMPKSCSVCPLKAEVEFDEICSQTGEYVCQYDRADDCPLAPVPKHGDLIDVKDIVPKGGYIIADGVACIPVKDIVNAPTIIPAEDEHTMEEFMYGQEGNPNDGSM